MMAATLAKGPLSKMQLKSRNSGLSNFINAMGGNVRGRNRNYQIEGKSSRSHPFSDTRQDRSRYLYGSGSHDRWNILLKNALRDHLSPLRPS